jgi:hypothetical protein
MRALPHRADNRKLNTAPFGLTSASASRFLLGNEAAESVSDDYIIAVATVKVEPKLHNRRE